MTSHRARRLRARPVRRQLRSRPVRLRPQRRHLRLHRHHGHRPRHRRHGRHRHQQRPAHRRSTRSPNHQELVATHAKEHPKVRPATVLRRARTNRPNDTPIDRPAVPDRNHCRDPDAGEACCLGDLARQRRANEPASLCFGGAFVRRVSTFMGGRSEPLARGTRVAARSSPSVAATTKSACRRRIPRAGQRHLRQRQ